MNPVLLSELLKDECLFNIIYKCNNESCYNNHSNETKLFMFGKSILGNLTKINKWNGRDIFIKLNQKFNKSRDYKIKINLCKCHFTHGECNSKIEKITIKYNNKPKTLKFCINEYKNNIKCNLHVDFLVTTKNKYILRQILFNKQKYLEFIEKTKVIKKTEKSETNFPSTLTNSDTKVEEEEVVDTNEFKKAIRSIPVVKKHEKKDIKKEILSKTKTLVLTTINQEETEEKFDDTTNFVTREEFTNTINKMQNLINKNTERFDLYRTSCVTPLSGKIRYDNNIDEDDDSLSDSYDEYEEEEYEC